MTDERNSNHSEREQRIRDAIRSTGEVRADASFRERLKREFASGAISEPVARPDETETRGVPAWAWLLAPAALAVLILVLFLPGPDPPWTVQAVDGAGEIEIEGQLVSTEDPSLLASALAAGGRIRVPEGVTLDVRLDDRLILELVEGTDLTFPAPPDRGDVGPLIAEVREGELRIKTGPGFPGTEMHIVTPESRTEIVGTIVSVYKGDGYTCVCVLEGTARVGNDGTTMEPVPAGNLKFMYDDPSSAFVIGISSEHKVGLVEFDDRTGSVF